MAKAQKAAISGFRAFWVTIKKSWALFRRSRLGIAGTVIISIFVFLAVFAPWVSPFTPEFLAPNEDVFVEISYNRTYSQEGNFLPPVIGPSSPKAPDAPGGRLWIIIAHDTGYIELTNVSRNQTPFSQGTRSIALRIQDFGLKTPISNLIYMVPGRNSVGGLNREDDLRRNGLIGFVANRSLVLMDPFQRLILFQQYIGFQPKWLVEDPVSAGDMYEFPLEQRVPPAPRGNTYRFIVAANDTHVSVFRVDYRSSQDVPPIPTGGVVQVVSKDMPVTGVPLAYYLQVQPDLSGIFVPTSSNRLAVFSINGTVWTNMTMSLDGEPANVSAPIGYNRAPEVQMLYVPLRSPNKAGIEYIYPRNVPGRNLTVRHTLVINDTSAMITTQPDPGNADTPHFVLTHYSGPNATSSDLLRGSSNGTLDPILNVHLSHPVKRFFYSPTNSLVLALDTEGTVWSAPTVSLSKLRTGLLNFFHNSDPRRQYLIYAGSAGGTKYSIQMASEEIFALMFTPSTGNAVVFKLLGASTTPLPPGKYPSGNTYILGTDDQGHDILTQLIWGSRVALEVGVLAALFSVVIGTLVGLVAGFYGGFLDTILMRMTDIALVLPFLPLVLILANILGPSILNIIIVIAVLGWPGIARVIRAQTLSLKERPFIDASRISGASRSRTMMVHVAPNVLPFAFLYMTLTVGGAILTEAAVSFLGFGDPSPSHVSWGIMLQTLSASGNTLTAWWWLLPPGLCITLISLGFYLVGRAIDEIINPRLRER